MKKNFEFYFSLLLLLWPTTMVFSQNPEFSIRGGFNLSTVAGENSNESKLLPGAHLGLFAALPVSQGLKVETGLSNSLKGTRSFEDNLPATFRLIYLDLPVNLRITLVENFELFLGPQVSWLLGSRTIIESANQTFIEKGTEGLNRFDIGFNLGAAYRFSQNLSIGASHEWGFISLDKQGSLNTYNRVAKVTLGYTFN